MTILAIDPSVNNVGLARYNTDTKKLRTWLHHPSRKLIGASKTQSMVHLGNSILRFILVEFLQGEKIDELVIEYPQWQGSTKGLIAMQKGYTLDLAFLTGVLATGFRLASCNVYTPTPMEWKGNIPKKATEKRVEKKFGSLQISEHEYDAIGLLLWRME